MSKTEDNFKLPFDTEEILNDSEFLKDTAKSFFYAIGLLTVTGAVGWLAADLLYRLVRL